MVFYNCELCAYDTLNKTRYTEHTASQKHIKNIQLEKNYQSKLYKCELCHYGTNQKGSIGLHCKAEYHIKKQGPRDW